MDFKTVVKDIVENKMEGFTFYYGRRSEANYAGDALTFPAVVLVEPDTGGLSRDPNMGRIHQSRDLFIQFLDKVPMGEHAEERHPVVMAMSAAAADFVQELDRSDIFRDLPSYLPMFLIVDRYDVNAAGWELNIPRLTPNAPGPC